MGNGFLKSGAGATDSVKRLTYLNPKPLTKKTKYQRLKVSDGEREREREREP